MATPTYISVLLLLNLNILLRPQAIGSNRIMKRKLEENAARIIIPKRLDAIFAINITLKDFARFNLVILAKTKLSTTIAIINANADDLTYEIVG